MSVANRAPSFETRNWKSASMRSSISTFGDVRVAQIPLNWPSTKIFQNTAKVGQAKITHHPPAGQSCRQSSRQPGYRAPDRGFCLRDRLLVWRPRAGRRHGPRCFDHIRS